MKKAILFLLILCAGLFVQAQDSTSVAKVITTTTETVYKDTKAAVGTVYQDGKDAVNYIVPKLETALAALAAGLKTTSEKVWVVLIAKRQVDGLVDASYWLILIVGSILLYRFFAPVYRNSFTTDDRYYWDNHTPETVAVVIGLLVLIVLGLVCLFSVSTMLRNLFVPEYGAMEDVIDMASELLKSARLTAK